jgi:hypothetical protein
VSRSASRPDPEGSAARTRVAVDRAIPFLRSVARATVRLAGIALAAGAVVWWAMFTSIPSDDPRAPLLVVGAILLLLPPAGLILFALATRTLIGLPDRIRRLPDAVRYRIGEVVRHSGALGSLRRSGNAFGRLRALFRLGWTVATSREVLEVLGPATILLRPWMLPLGVLAAIAAVVELLLGLVALLSLALA